MICNNNNGDASIDLSATASRDCPSSPKTPTSPARHHSLASRGSRNPEVAATTTDDMTAEQTEKARMSTEKWTDLRRRMHTKLDAVRSVPNRAAE